MLNVSAQLRVIPVFSAAPPRPTALTHSGSTHSGVCPRLSSGLSKRSDMTATGCHLLLPGPFRP